MVIFKDFFTYSINNKSSEDALWPASNVLSPERQFAYWKTENTADSWIILDLGTAQQVTGIALMNVNYTSFKIQGSTTTSFVSPAVDSGTLTAVKDTMRGRYYAYTSPQTYSPAFNYRFLRLWIPTQSTTDGAAYFKTGGIVVKTGTTEVIFNPDWSLTISLRRPADVVEMRGGRREVRNISERLATMTFTMTRDMREDTEIEELGDLFMTIDETDSLLVYDNGNFLTYPTNSPSVYVFKRVDIAGGTYSKYPIFNLDTITFLEQK